MAQDMNISVGLDPTQVLQGLQKIGTELNNIANKAKDAFNSMNGGITSFTDKFNPLNAAITDLTGALGALATIGFAKAAAEWANSMDNVARSVGMTIPELLELQSAVTQSGGNAQAASRGIEMFYMKLDQARQGGTQQQYAFERLGITLKDLATLDDRDLFKLTIQRLAQMPRDAASSRIEVELLSKSFRGIPLDKINEELEKARGQFANQGPVISQASEAYNKLQGDIQNLKIAFLTLAQPLMEAFAGTSISVQDFVKGLKIALEVITGIIALNFTLKLFAMVDGFMALVGGIRAAVIAMEAFTVAEGVATMGISSILGLIAKFTIAAGAAYGVTSVIGDLDKKLEENAGKNKEAAQAAQEKVDADRKAALVGQEVYKSYDRINAGIVAQTNAFKENIQAQIDKFNAQSKYVGLSEAEIAKLNEEIKVREQFATKIRDLQTKLTEAQAAKPDSDQAKTVDTLKNSIKELQGSQEQYAIAAGDAAAKEKENNNEKQMSLLLDDQLIKILKNIEDVQISMDELTMTNDEKKLANIDKQTQAYIALEKEKRRAQLGPDADLSQDATLQKNIDKIINAQDKLKDKTKEEIALSRDFSTGWNGAASQFIADATNAGAMGQKAFSSFTTNIGKSIDTFVQTGKFSFGDLTRSILQDLVKMELQFEEAQLFKMLGLDKSGGGSILGSIFSGLGFADGGDPPVGKASIVGENGPELFVPKTPGTIVPNNAMSGGNNNSPTPTVTHNYNYNINAIDQRSVAQFFAENRKTMLGTMQMAQKELPYYNQ